MLRKFIILVALAASLTASLAVLFHSHAPVTLVPGAKGSPSGQPAADRHAPSEDAQPVSTSENAVTRSKALDALTPELRELAEHDPAIAAMRLPELPASLRPQFASIFASAWGKAEPEVAASWASNQLEGETRTAALFSLSVDWASRSPAAAASALNLIPDARQGEFLNVVGTQWARQDPTAALAWAEEVPAGSARDSFLGGVASILGETSPVQAAQLAAALTTGSLQNDTALTVAIEWSRTDPLGAAEWVKMFPAGDLRQRTLRNLVSVWAAQSPQSPPEALLTWPEGPERDQAIRHYLDEVLETEPSRGLQVLSAIGDSNVRSEESQRLVQHWLMLDPTAANAWISRSGPGSRN